MIPCSKSISLVFAFLILFPGSGFAQNKTTDLRVSAPLVQGIKISPKSTASQKNDQQRKDALEPFHAIVRDYLLTNPEVIQEALLVLQQRQRQAQAQGMKKLLSEQQNAIYNDTTDQVWGNINGDVTVVEFFDFQCGYCKRVHPSIKALINQDPNVRVVLKQLPVLGPNSMLAAQYALAAAQQGRYTEYHDAVIQLDNLNENTLIGLASELKLDVAKLSTDAKSLNIQSSIINTIRLAEALNINGTPGFIIGNQITPGAIDLDGMLSLVAAARRQQQ